MPPSNFGGVQERAIYQFRRSLIYGQQPITAQLITNFQGEREPCGRTREKNSSSRTNSRTTLSTPSPIQPCRHQNSKGGKGCHEEFASKTPTSSRPRLHAEYRRNQDQDRKSSYCENCAIRAQYPRLVVVDGRCCHQGLCVHLLYVPLLQQQPCGQLPQQQPYGRLQQPLVLQPLPPIAFFHAFDSRPLLDLVSLEARAPETQPAPT